MGKSNSTMEQQIAQATSAFEKQRTGHSPKSVSVVLKEDILLITLRGALSPAERDLAKTPAGIAQLREFHRQLFANASGPLRQEIERITGAAVREVTTDVETIIGALTHIFATGIVIQVFLLAHAVPAETWSSSRLYDQ
jgi:uncharacterized protein YbcI